MNKRIKKKIYKKVCTNLKTGKLCYISEKDFKTFVSQSRFNPTRDQEVLSSCLAKIMIKEVNKPLSNEERESLGL